MRLVIYLFNLIRRIWAFVGDYSKCVFVMPVVIVVVTACYYFALSPQGPKSFSLQMERTLPQIACKFDQVGVIFSVILCVFLVSFQSGH